MRYGVSAERGESKQLTWNLLRFFRIFGSGLIVSFANQSTELDPKGVGDAGGVMRGNGPRFQESR